MTAEVVAVKRCGNCGETKPRGEFHRDRSTRDCLVRICKACAREYQRANAERIAEQRRQHRQVNAEGIAERRRQYREANRERIAEQKREQYWADREQIAERRREQYRTNREHHAEQMRRYRYGITPEQYAALLADQGGRCAGCGVTECPTGRALSVDHDHGCCPHPAGGPGMLRACGNCVRGLLCAPCNLADALDGAPHVNWSTLINSDGGIS